MACVLDKNKMYRLCTWVLWFVFYSFIGWFFETVFTSLEAGHLTQRGFLYGPICPIYGFGALLLLLIFREEHPRFLAVFCTGFLAVTLLEYVTSYGLEVLFGQRWWDYYHWPLNINGRVSLLTSLAFGLMGAGLVLFLHPRVKRLLQKLLSPTATIVAGICCLGLIAVDLTATLFSLC